MDSLSYERLVQKLFPGSRLRRTWSLKGGISAEMTALEILRPGEETQRWIVRRPGEATLRQRPHAAEDEFRLLQALHALELPTPAPYALDLSREILDAPYLVMAYVDGDPDFAPARPDDFARQMAQALARIHAVDVHRADLSWLPRLEKSQVIHPAPAHMNASLEEVRIRDILEPAWPFPQPNSPALLHGDFWPGNLLWQEGQFAAVVDWEDAAAGDPLADLAISRLDLLWIYGREMMVAFTQDYLAKTALDPRSLPYWDLTAALRLIRLAGSDLTGWAAFFYPYGRTDITEQSIRSYYQEFVKQALDRLEKI